MSHALRRRSSTEFAIIGRILRIATGVGLGATKGCYANVAMVQHSAHADSKEFRKLNSRGEIK
jgi:hypothetical protein